jgi:apolipoprotein N-acyltransferase
LGLFVPGLFWATSFNWYGGIIIMALEALFLAAACIVTPPGRGRMLALCGAMVLMEALRDRWPFGGVPLGGIALGQVAGPLGGSARLGGPLLIVMLVWLGGAAVGVLVATGIDMAQRHWSLVPGRGVTVTGHRRATVARLLGSAAIVVIVAGVIGASTVGPDGGAGTATVRVAAVQGGGVRGLRQSQVDPGTVFAAQIDATDSIPRGDQAKTPTLVLWPENALALPAPIAADGEAVLGSFAVGLHATFVVGVTETVSSTQFRNEVLAFSPRGKLIARYEKVHRVPFGEYVPGRALFSHLADLSAVPRDAIAGHGVGVLHTPAGSLGTMISYEVFFSNRGRSATRAGAKLLIVPTNTSSYSTSQVPRQELAASQLQAIAEGRDLVQVSPTGFSAVIDNHGRVAARSELSKPTVIVRDVSLRSGRTVYERFGDLPVLVIAALLVLGGWAIFLGSRTPAILEKQRRETQGEPEGRGERT